jgi:hypothetical protein
MSTADGWSPCCCGNKCGFYIYKARKTTDEKSKDLCGKCRVAVRDDLFRRLSAALGIPLTIRACALFYILTGHVIELCSNPRLRVPLAPRLGHKDPTKSITRNLSDTGEFNAFPTSQLLEEFVGSDNINDMLAPNNIAATKKRFDKWFASRTDVERKAFTSSSYIHSSVTSMTERLQLVEQAMGSPMNVDGARVSNTGDVTIGVDLRSRNALPTAIFTSGKGLVFEGMPFGIGSRAGAGSMDIVSKDMPSGIGSRAGAGSMDIVPTGIPEGTPFRCYR